MNAEEFNKLDFEEQDKLLYEKATKLTTIAQEWHDVTLYSLKDFFVEYRMPKDHDADDIKALTKEEFNILYKSASRIIVT